MLVSALTLLLALSGGSNYVPQASEGLERLAITGAPELLAKELNDNGVSAFPVHGNSGIKINLTDGQHLAPHYVHLADGTIIQMVAPTVNHDWFIVAYPDGSVVLLDYSDTFG